MFDVVIAGGTVVDGTGGAGYRADVGIAGETIEAIEDLSHADAGRRIDATGLTVSPGFIDPHTHAEGALLVDPQLACGLRQGITTVFLGIDGMSYAPLSRENYRIYRHWLGGLLGDPPDELDMGSVAAFRSHYHGKVAVNTAYLVPHATIRLEVLGFRDRPLRGEPLDEAKRLIREGLEQGAVGFTTGSKYYPGPWGDTHELVELCRVVREAGKVYMSEPRSLERAFGGGGVTEAMEIVRQTGVRLHLAHYRTSADTAGRLDRIMGPIDQARTADADVTFDIYPYPSGSSIPVSFLPGPVQEGGPEAILRRLSDPEQRRQIGAHLDAHQSAFLRPLTFSYAPEAPALEGRRLQDLARERGRPLGETLCEVLFEQRLRLGHVTAPPDSAEVRHQIDRDCLELLARPDYMACSDLTPAGSCPHPRCYGAFPRLLGRLRRELGTLSLEAMIHRMTDRPARRFGLTRRGRIEKGYFADVTLFDADRVIDTATYATPRRFPTGIPYVVVNGAVAVDNERCTGLYAGHAVP